MTVHDTSDGPGRVANARDETGMVTSEYAIGTMGACGIACVLLTMAPGFVDFLRRILEGAFSPIITGLLW
jgi:hypothetical protein